jgi:hypothetical protein
MKTVYLRTTVPLTVTVYHAPNEFASDGDSAFRDAAGRPSDVASEQRRVDADTEIAFADQGALTITGDGEIELENRSDAELNVRGRFQRADASPERGPGLPPGARWQLRLAAGHPVRVRSPSALDRGLRGLWRRWRG